MARVLVPEINDVGLDTWRTLMSSKNFAGDLGETTDSLSIVASGVLTAAGMQSLRSSLRRMRSTGCRQVYWR